MGCMFYLMYYEFMIRVAMGVMIFITFIFVSAALSDTDLGLILVILFQY